MGAGSANPPTASSSGRFGTDWWRHGVIYQVYPRSFADTDGDGVGDLPGVLARLDYLVDLGVDAIWLSPIYPSPGRDVGYDVSDHATVDPLYGREADFDRLVAAAHERGIRIVLDLVMNHTSDEHAWFEASRASRDGPKADWYLWRDPAGYDAAGQPLPPNNWLSWFGGSAWAWEERRQQFYLHTFLVEQPDLNFRNPDVEAAQWAMVRGWLARGVDGFRLDVFNAFLKHPDLPDNPVRDGSSPWDRQEHVHDRDQADFPELIARFRAIVDEAPGRMSVGELFASEREQAARLMTDRHLVFDWGLVHMPWSADAIGAIIDDRERIFGGDKWLANVLSNHDQPRQASRLAASAGIADTDAVARAAALLLLTLRGTPFLYYGEEIGMRDVPVPDDEIIDPPARRALVDPEFSWYNRDQCRSPIPWTADPAGHGFTTGRPWLRLADDADSRNVATQEADPGSVLATYRRLIRLRSATEPLLTGRLARVAGGAEDVLAWTRTTDDARVVVVLNLADAPREARPALPGGGAWRALDGTHLDPAEPDADGWLVLRPLEGVVLAAR
jgi:alpha-glucosidase